jgi:2,3-bisphosphoglycerate-independent phosphoglycerate mutase
MTGTTVSARPKPLILIILDGWGIAPPSRANAITLAKTPAWDHLTKTYPVWSLQASGEAVGLTWGEMGNSEVGHLAIGTGRIVYQSLPRISRNIADGSFFNNPQLVQACAAAKASGGRLHLIGLFSSGGVHSFHEHGLAVLELAKQQGVSQVFVHAILDGRDTPYRSGYEFISKLQAQMASLGLGKVASVCGRYWAMDRDNRWERTQAAYSAIVDGQAEVMAEDPLQAITDSYQKNVNDEELAPTVIIQNNQPIATVQPGDSVVFFNFRADRMRQLVTALALPGFTKFTPYRHVDKLTIVTLTEYVRDLPVAVAFLPETVTNPLAAVLAQAGLTQLHIAETEKYAHVTYFINGGQGAIYPGEQQVLIPSPKVSSYDAAPAMSSNAITDRVLRELSTQAFDVIIINFASADMVAHTGNLPASITAVESLDECLGQITSAALAYGGVCIITADHGNAEQLFDPFTGHIDKEHSRVPVPCVLVGKQWEGKIATPGFLDKDLSQIPASGVLADVAPTILKILALRKPDEMTGRSLI